MAHLCMNEISKTLIEMIAEDTPNASIDMSCGARGTIFREIFVFHYPTFIEELQKLASDLTKDEGLLCMLIALQQTADEMVQLLCLPAAEVLSIRESVHRKTKLIEEGELEGRLRDILKRLSCTVS